MDLPNDRPLSEPEIAVAVAEAVLNDQQNPGKDLPFQPSSAGLLARLGMTGGRPTVDRAWERAFHQANPDLEIRLAAHCWKLVGLGFLVPQMGGTWGAFHVTPRGREALAQVDATAITNDGLDRNLADLGLASNDLPRQYARLAQDCFLAGHYESSIVMLGVASEALIGQLATALENVQARIIPTNRARPANVTARQDLTWIAETLANQRNPIRAALRGAGVDDTWLEPLRDQLAGAGQTIRLTRNDYGHPTGITATQAEALPLLTMFPRFAGDCIRGTQALAQV